MKKESMVILGTLFLTLLQLSGGAVTAAGGDYQLLNVQEVVAETKTHQPKTAATQSLEEDGVIKNGGNLSLRLLHRDHVLPRNFTGHHHHHHRHQHHYHHRFLKRMKRDIGRVAYLDQKLTTAGKSGGSSDYKVADFGAEVVSGMQQGSGEYFVRIGVGSPARSQYMVIDSGSDIVWVQCQPCSQCYRQADPVFDPAYSATFSGVSCSSSVCSRLEKSGCHAGRCRYEVSYGDGSYTKGTLALETLTFENTLVRNVAIGCGHKNHGLFIGAAGLLGLGNGQMSFNGQLGGQMGGAFAYCLVSRGTVSSGWLLFGRTAVPAGAVLVPLLRNPRAPSFYYVGLAGLGVGGTRIPVPDEVFRLSADGGFVIDSGTAVTRLPAAAYTALREAFLAGTAGLPRASGVSIFDTCYDLFGYQSVRVPTVSFYFSGGPILTLPARNFLVPVDDSGTFCFAFASSSSGLAILGNFQQEGIQISFDEANGFVGFGPQTC